MVEGDEGDLPLGLMRIQIPLVFHRFGRDLREILGGRREPEPPPHLSVSYPFERLMEFAGRERGVGRRAVKSRCGTGRTLIGRLGGVPPGPRAVA
jgi:hypothetical protein